VSRFLDDTLQLILRNARLRNSERTTDIGIDDGRIVAINRGISGRGEREVDCGGMLVIPPFTNPHLHMDKCLTGQWMKTWSDRGSPELIPNAAREKARITESAIYESASRVIRDSIGYGVLALRGFCDVDSINRLKSIGILMKLKEQFKRSIVMQLVAFPQEGIIRDSETEELLRRALEGGADVVGGIPWFEKTVEAKERHIDIVFDLAKDYGKDVHMLIDDNEDPNSRCIEYLAKKTIRERFQGRVSASHCRGRFSLSYEDYAKRIIALLKQAGITVVENPHVSLLIYGRAPGYPKSRGVTRVKELLGAGVNVAIGQDDIDDPYYPFGRGDMLELGLFMAHAAHMSSFREIEDVMDMITTNGAKAMRLKGYGLAVGKRADLVVLNGASSHDVLRRQSERSYVIRNGRLVSETKVTISQHVGSSQRNPRTP